MPVTATELYAETGAAVPELDALVAARGDELDGGMLLDALWLRRRLTDTAVRWDNADPRVNATLWWYSASSTLVAPVIASLVVCGRCPDIAPASLRLSLASNGYLATSRSRRLLEPGAPAAGERLGSALTSIIGRIAAVGGASERALWAIAADSLATRSLWVGAATGDIAGAAALGCALAIAVGPAMPRLRYVEVPVPESSAQLAVRRCSCCLIYQVPAKAKCVSCPRRHPEERRRLLAARTR